MCRRLVVLQWKLLLMLLLPLQRQLQCQQCWMGQMLMQVVCCRRGVAGRVVAGRCVIYPASSMHMRWMYPQTRHLTSAMAAAAVMVTCLLAKMPAQKLPAALAHLVVVLMVALLLVGAAVKRPMCLVRTCAACSSLHRT